VLVSVMWSGIALVLTLSGPSGGGAAAAQRSDSLFLEAGGRVTVLRQADLAGLPRDTVRAPFRRGPVLTYTGVRLPDLLRRAGGRPLPEAEGPFRLLAPGDGGEHARWVRGSVAVRVRTD
jgi:hypothetical protein